MSEPEKWLGHLGEDRDWFEGWICGIGGRPSYNPEAAARYDACVAKLSPREVEECRVVGHANTIDVMHGRDEAISYMKRELAVIRVKYEAAEVPADEPLRVEVPDESH